MAALTTASSILSVFSSAIDTASKAYDFVIKIEETKQIDKLGVHIGPV